ncbi:MAG TPA: ABC transporter permease [Gemmatimonadota bacterium]|nr:ABC transporter permease [Gemmatimonadota bacterium]
MTSIIQDIRYAVRGFIRAPGFVAVAVTTLALGVGATTSILSVVNGVVLRRLPFPDSEQLVRLYSTEGGQERDNHSGANFLDIKDQSESFENLAGFVAGRFNLAGAETPRVVRGSIVTPDFFSVLGVNALLGRTLSPGVDIPGGEVALVISHSLWQSQFAGDVAVLGRSLWVDGGEYTVVGVMPSGFGFPGDAQFWAASRYRVPDPPVNLGVAPADNRGAQYFHAVGRLKGDIDLAQAQTEMTMIAERLAEDYPEVNANEGLLLVPLHESVVGNVSSTLYVLLGAVGLLLLIACGNVAGLLLVRASGREKEIVLRSALGAGRMRIVRQLLTESIVLSVLGGIVGFLVALWGTQALLALAPEGIPRVSEVDADLRVLGFTLAIVLGTGLLFGLAPAIQSFGNKPAISTIAGGSRLTSNRARGRLRSGLIVSEVALSLLLLVGAGLTVRTYVALNRVDPGFDPRRTLSARVEIPGRRYPGEVEQSEFYRETLERVKAIPGVLSAGGVLSLPINAGISGDLIFEIEGRPLVTGEETHGGYQLASSDYFRTLGIPLVRGRVFTEADDAEAPGVAVINQALADLYWGDEEPIGQRVTWDDPSEEDADWATIVGIVGNTRYEGLDEAPRPEIFRPYAQAPMPYMTLVVRSEMEASGLTSAIRQAVMEVDAAQPIYEVHTMEQVLSDSLGSRRFSMYVLGFFALAALILAAVGLYGVLSSSVAQRSNEIAIRMAVGAQVSEVISRVIKQGLWLAAIGSAIGIGGAIVLTRLMANMIYGVSTIDPLTFAAGIALVSVVALAASWVPALRAARADPMEVLRGE